jgi:hypothetical protein
MASTVRSVDFLPEIFQTDANKQFLAATLDQLIQEPKFKKTQGFIGRTVGPGVNPNDKYVVEPDKTRADYQLEVGVVSLKPDTDDIQTVITYPGINDAVAQQGGITTRPDRLYSSEFYSWDPFVDFDTFINFSQYYWLPTGPDAVDVAATGVPASDNFVVTRENGAYTFSGLAGENPTIELLRNGNYTFQVAQNNKETVNYRVRNSGNSSYTINYEANPALTLARGNTYVFNLNLTGDYPFWIKTEPSTGLGDIYSSGVSRNGAVTGLITFVVPQDAPDTLYYSAQTQSNMNGVLNIVDGVPGTGPGFWIQSAPGVSGQLPATPNISSREVLGVINNGEDLGTVTFNVPSKTAQEFYYNLTNIGVVNLITDLQFDQINNQPIASFIAQYGGIDGVTNLNGRTLIFDNYNPNITDAETTGWQRTTLYDPLIESSANNGLPGSFDSIPYDQVTDIPPEDRYQIWQITYSNIGGELYLELNKITDIAPLEKFNINYGNVYSSTQWYKDNDGLIKQIPALTAIQDTVYYQDGTDPSIFGRIKLLDQTQQSTLFVDEIIGKKNYTAANGVVFTNGLKIIFRGDVEPATYLNTEYYVSGVGTAIELLPVSNFITPETYVPETNDSGLPIPEDLDYLTIDRSAQNLNAWSRSNRWFHVDVISATSRYNNTTTVLDNNYRAKRPIIQFRPDIRLWNMGTQGKQPIDAIDFEETDALSNVNGQPSYTVNGYSLVQGSRVIFAADEDADVRNKIYVVNFISPDSALPLPAPLTAQPYINLVPASDGEVLLDQSVVCLYGTNTTGITFWFDGTEWTQAQQKTGVQQAPLFDVYDPDGISFGNTTKYQSTTFAGSKLFSYAVGDTNILDPVLQFPLQYLNINNVGDIVFQNNLYKDTFLYVQDNVSVTSDISSGSVREYIDRLTYQLLIGWQTAVSPTTMRQQFKFTYTTATLKLDVKVVDDNTVPPIQLYVGSKFQEPSVYTYTTTDNSTTITLLNTYVIGDVIEVAVLSDQVSQVAFYQPPFNLEKNPLNGNSDAFTLGTIRTHYESICENLLTLNGAINGPNNSRDLGNLVPYGQIILQQSAPVTMAGYFLRSDKYNIFGALQYNSREYTKFKALMLDAVTRQTINFQTPSEILNTAIQDITVGRVETQPFYWSDMLPQGAVYTSTTYTVTVISTSTFDTVQVYDYTSANYLGLLVYLNNRLLVRGVDYVVATDGPRFTILVPLAVGDVVLVDEYASTAGNFVPNTPTKLGLYPAWQPAVIQQRSSKGYITGILGHDGSFTPAFEDIRDQVLLEFETRIYNNLKLDGNPVPMTIYDVLPGQFRDTGYTYAEINNIFAGDFMSYVAWNKLDYKTQAYNSTNSFTYNYSGSQNKLDNENLLGAWRGIYRYFYDTEQPQLTPWEMLGFSIKPTWWESTYGAAPYTQDNLVLWDDLEAGYVRDPITPYYKPEFARPGLTRVIPTGTEGDLLSPFESVVGNYNAITFQKSWALGDGSPVEASWWNSSSYPFSVMHVLAVTRPAKFFSLFADRDLYRYNTDYQQYLYNNRYRLDANGIEVYGNGVSKASFVDWIVDYNRQTGVDSTDDLTADLKFLDVRLCYRMASFSDKQYIKLYTEKSSPNSTNTALQIPDESYDLLLYKNQPFDRINYSAVVVQQTPGGYAVFGYSTVSPYFEIVQSKATGQLQTISAGGVSVQVPTLYTDTVVQVPYGFVFPNQSGVVDFLLCYGRLMQSQGLTFTNYANGYLLDWQQMSREFLYWSTQGWEDNALINLNPLANKLSVTSPGLIVDSIRVQTTDDILLDQNRRQLDTRSLNIVRLDNTFTAEPLTGQTLSYIDLSFTTYEHMIVLRNQSVFGDLMYDPVTGARQNRLNLVAVTTTDWNGTVNAQGFILNQDNVEEWTGLRTYSKGEIVKYKNVYWSALTIVQPSTAFDFNYWVQSDYTQIELGLLPNLSNKANQLANSYNTNAANIESDNDLLSYGLIGFRPRQYMAALNLDDVSQINIYQQFLGSKGTQLSAELFARANLGKETGDYDIYENWAVQRAVYGANANRSFFELRLNRALLDSNPSLVQVTYPQEPSQADQQIFLNDVWRQSYRLTSPDILPTTTVLPTDIGLPTAGYVNIDDADITVFSINDPADLSANLDSIQVGTSIWVAKINEYDWNIYRADNVPGQIQHVCDNLNGTSRVIFSTAHGLVDGDYLIIKYFDTEVDGVYRVLGVPNINTVNIAFTFTAPRVQADAIGIGYTLQTMRVSQASDVDNLPYALRILPGARVWVDNDGAGRWEVLEKQDVFSTVVGLSPVLFDATERYGYSVTQAVNRLAALVGSPRYGFNLSANPKGGVYVYVKNYSDQYTPVSPLVAGDAILTLGATGVRGYGNAVDFGNQTWAVAGASASLGPSSQTNNGYACVIYRNPVLGQPGVIPYAQWQLLTQPGTTTSTTPGAGEFGYSVTMSLDERWMYIGAPGLNLVHAYGRVDWQNQVLQSISDGSTVSYDISDVIQIDQATQLRVLVDGRVLTLGVDYTVSGDFSTVLLTTSADPADVVEIQRNYIAVLPTNGSTVTFDLGDYFFTANNIYSFSVTVNDALLRPNIDYTFNIATQVVTFQATYLSTDIVIVTAESYFNYVNSVTVAGLAADARFGHSVSTSTDGRQVIVGTPYVTVDGETQAGAVYVFDRNVQRFTVTNANDNTYTVLGATTQPVAVILNNQFLLNEDDAIAGADGTFAIAGSTVTINATLSVGDIIEIETNQFVRQQSIVQNTVADFSNYGTSVDLCLFNCSLYSGAPQSSAQIFKGGIVERNVNQARVYGTITATVANPVLTVGNTLRINNQDVLIPAASGSTTSLQGLANNINSQVINVTAAVSSTGFLTISVKNSGAAAPGNRLQVAPGSVGTAYSDLGFECFVWTQNIQSPYPTEMAQFGQSISINDTADALVVGAPAASLYLEMLFDDGTTIFDGNSTIFFTLIAQCGAVYTYDYLPSSTDSVANPGMFVFGSQIGNSDLTSLAQYGFAVNYTSGVLMTGAPGWDAEDSSDSDYGSVWVYENPDRSPAWVPIHVQQPVVDIRLLNSVFLYDRVTSSTTEFLDFFDPIQGKILGAAQQNIDYTGAVDPASYNIGPVNVRGTTWGIEHVNDIWWDIGQCRFIDPNQDNIVYASRRWGQLFPDSSVDIYQWIKSEVSPADYAGPGTPRDIDSYSINTRLNRDGVFKTEYYFWVKGITTVANLSNKTLSVSTIAQYIENPRASGIAYMAPINASTIALYNCGDLIAAEDTVIHVEFDRELNNDNVHVEYELIAQDRADAFLSTSLYRKLQDSFCGVDTFGNLVPDPNLSIAERYGVQFRPRQSMFVDRFEALKNYLTRANSVMVRYPLSENATFNLLNSSEPIPPSIEVINGVTITNWNAQVPNLEVLGFQNIYTVALGYKYLVISDSDNRGLWTIYTVQNSQTEAGVRVLTLTRVQGYNTPDYWSYVNWYLPGYNPSTKAVAEVATYSALFTISVSVGSSVRVTANAQGKWEIYIKTVTGWDRVGLQDGTIEFSAELYDYALGRFGFDVEVFDAQYFDQEPVVETRKIIQAINEELFVGDLAIERNRALILMFNFVLSEFSAPEWLVKTSLIDVDHRIRALIPYQNYVRDNQEFVLDYIQEVKPYHVQIREFNLNYNGQDVFGGDLTDFDVPAYYNTDLTVPQFTSPVLLPYNHGTAQVSNYLSDVPASSTVWTNWPWSQWYNNYLLSLEGITVVEAGTGYFELPQIIIQGDAIEQAEAVAVTDSLGRIVAINVINPGSGYQETPTVVFDGGNGTGARAYAVMSNDMVRSFRTVIRYDRYQYVPTVTLWSTDGTYENGMLVRYDNRVWRAENADGSSAVVGPTFDLENWQLVPASELSGVDRTMGFYVPGINEPGLDLPLLIDGINYPGVQVWGDYFLGTTTVDATYESEFTNTLLGDRFSDINVVGGQFVGVYEGHAPEELVNGAEFDTLDIRVFTRPGSDWSLLDSVVGADGHGFQVGTRRYVYDLAITDTYSWAGIVEHPIEVLVANQTTGQDLNKTINYVVDWVAQTITIVSGVSNGQTINITVYELGGGSQLYRANYTGADIGRTLIVPVDTAQIAEIALFVDGVPVTDNVSWLPWIESVTWNDLTDYAKQTIVKSNSVYYRALQYVPVGVTISNTAYWLSFVPTLASIVDLGFTPVATQGIALVVMGGTLVDPDPNATEPYDSTNFSNGIVNFAPGSFDYSESEFVYYSWSTPLTQVAVADATIVANRIITLTNSLQGTNPANLIVTRNGTRLRPAEGIEWIGDDTSVSFGLPQRGAYSQSLINAPTDIQVWLDNILQVQSVGSVTGDYSVTPWTGSNTPGRQVVFVQPPPSGSRILISVNTLADYDLAGNLLEIIPQPNLGDVYAITTWNDTAQQNILTLVFQGPITTGGILDEPFDSTPYDLADADLSSLDLPGSYDYSIGTVIPSNDFWLQRADVTASRLWVTLDGVRLFEGEDFTVDGEYLILASGPIGSAQVLAVTEFTNSVVPDAIGFRVFQDMRGVQAVFRITNATTTVLTQNLAANADVIYVDNAAALGEPNLPNGVFGVITIDGERIMYRHRELDNNTLSGLLRGTAGTAAADHMSGTSVYDMSRSNLLSEQYQDYVVSNSANDLGTEAPGIVEGYTYTITTLGTTDFTTIGALVNTVGTTFVATSAGSGTGRAIIAGQTATKFIAPSINPASFNDSAIETNSIEVYVGGVRQYAVGNTAAKSQYRYFVTDWDPAAIEFVVDDSVYPPLVAPADGSEVLILVRQGSWWYNVATEAERNQALQESQSPQARFFRGQ